MFLEPCCFNTHLDQIWNNREAANEPLFTYGDTDLQMLMEYLVNNAPNCDVYLVLVKVEPETIQTIEKLMKAKIKGTEQFLVRSFVLLSQGSQRKEIASALGKFRQDGRLIVCEYNVAFRCLCVGNGENHFVIEGSIPQTKNRSMQMFSFNAGKDYYHKVMGTLNYRSK